MPQARRRTESMREHPGETEHDRELSESVGGQQKARRLRHRQHQGCDEQRTNGLGGIDGGDEPAPQHGRGTGAPAPTARHRPRPPRARSRQDQSLQSATHMDHVRGTWRAGHQRHKQQAVKPTRTVGSAGRGGRHNLKVTMWRHRGPTKFAQDNVVRHQREEIGQQRLLSSGARERRQALSSSSAEFVDRDYRRRSRVPLKHRLSQQPTGPRPSLTT